MLSNSSTIFPTEKKDNKRIYVEEANNAIENAVNSYMEKERDKLIQELKSNGITGEQAEKILIEVRKETKNKLVFETAKHAREFKEAAKRGDFSWVNS
jgi:hypothetical protein